MTQGELQDYLSYKDKVLRCIFKHVSFLMQRGGILYGRVDDDGSVIVDVIYEPPQSATASSLQLERGTEEEARVDHLAEALG